ncbi:MAG: thioredoxin family protein, partial [Gammaproteobacteria bacterium]|nr:thioredoxin family protein [Gammaproteobacteria bacterium]
NINSLPKYSLKYDPARDPFKDGYAAIENAKMTQRRILIEVGGEWCSWCHMIERFLDENPDVKIALHQTFVILKVNVSDSNDNQAFLSSLPKPLGYPHMYVSEKDGTILLSKDTAELISDGQYSRQKFLEFIKYWTLENE